MENKGEGYSKGEICNRDGCDGVISEHHIEGSCSCHINPPCSYCVEPKEYCPKCDWDAKDVWLEHEKFENDYWTNYHNRPDVIAEKQRLKEQEEIFYKMYRGEVPVTEYKSRHKSHTHFSQIIYGVHPNMSKEVIESKVKGTFGGRFTRFNEFSFEYVAYTD